ncbi:PP2C family protein-serine/threonine phosphatase [Maridesulfovibrio sp.]|uniref:PP2C family protein-serine/threonine phosphatase n=1 Tax=Maridesulfovibrio sp. TaxID=2795000 RepID=UPI0039EF3B64
MRKELAVAADYVTSLLPDPLKEGDIQADWRFIPSTSLGGDSFGYHWLDDDHFAMYLLDVCDHGVGSALLSVSAMNVLRSQTLPDTDFLKPDMVLEALNDSFQMDQQNNLYFTMWYGVLPQV